MVATSRNTALSVPCFSLLFALADKPLDGVTENPEDDAPWPPQDGEVSHPPSTFETAEDHRSGSAGKASHFGCGVRPIDPAASTKLVMRSVSRRYRALSEELSKLDAQIELLAREAILELVALDRSGRRSRPPGRPDFDICVTCNATTSV